MSQENKNENKKIYIVRKKVTRIQVVYPENLSYICPAFPPRRGYLTISIGGEDYQMFAIAPGNKFELVYPKSHEDGWIPTCVQQYIGPDLVMISEYCYSNYVKLI